MTTALLCPRSGNAQHKGWFGITCEGRGNGARVLVVDLPGVGVAGELLPYFGRLGALLFLVRHSLWSAAFHDLSDRPLARLQDMPNNPGLTGDVSALMQPAIEARGHKLRHLNLRGCPAVTGGVQGWACGTKCTVF